MKRNKIIQLLSIILTGLIGINSLGLTAFADDSVWGVNLSDPSQLDSYTGTETDLTLPIEVNGVEMKTIGSGLFGENTSITSVVVPEGYTVLLGSFRNCTSLKSILLPNSLETMMGNFKFRGCTSLEYVNIPYGISGEIKTRCFQDCSNPNLVIDIQSPSISSIGSNAFLNVTGTIKTYTQAVYDLVKESATTANVILIEDNTKELKEVLGTAAAYDKANYTNDSYAVLSDAVTSANALLEKESATSEEIEEAITAINNAISGLVKRDWIEFDKVLAQAEDLVQNHKYEYTYESWLRLSSRTVSAKEYKKSVTGEITENIQRQINNHEDNMKSGINSLVALDKTEVFNELVQTIETAESYDKEDFTEESYADLALALEAAKLLTEESSFEELALAKEAIETALENLEIDPGIIEEPGAPFIKVEKNAKEAVLDTYTADESTAGAVKIKITMNCAEDVNFNQYASIELKATIAETENWLKLTGTGEQNEAIYGEQGIVLELPLTNAISVGDEVKLTAYTYAWNGAADYVYGITKVEYINEVGQILKVVTDRTIALDELKADITEAEAIEQGDYTDESFAVLQTAIGAAKLVADDAEKTVIDEAREALAKAIAGLTTEPIIVTGTVTGTIKVSDENAETEMTVTAVSADGTETSITATSMGTYSIENLETGDYTLIISGGKYAPRTYEVTVEAVDLAFDVELNPLGDINGDGKVTTADVGMANSHAKGVTELTGYEFVCANVSAEDEEVTTADVGAINSHAKSVSTLW